MRVIEFLGLYEAGYINQIISQARAKSCINKLNSLLGDRELESLDFQAIFNYRIYRKNQGVSDSSVNRELAVLGSSLKWGRDNSLTSINPTINRVKEKTRTKSLSEVQISLIASKACDYKTEAYIWLLFLTGQRKTAVLELKHSHIDARNIDFTPSDALGHRRKKRAIIPLSPKIRLILERLSAKYGSSDYVLDNHGKPYTRQLDDNLKEAAANAGLPWVTAHVFRHSTATNLLEKGIPVEQVSRYLGHSNTRITERVYIHSSPEYLNQAAMALGA